MSTSPARRARRLSPAQNAGLANQPPSPEPTASVEQNGAPVMPAVPPNAVQSSAYPAYTKTKQALSCRTAVEITGLIEMHGKQATETAQGPCAFVGAKLVQDETGAWFIETGWSPLVTG